MHARIIEGNVKPGQMKSFLKTTVERHLPLLKQQPGFVEAIALTSESDHDKFVALSIWKSKEDADRFTNGPGQQLKQSTEAALAHEPATRNFNLEASSSHDIERAQTAVAR
jgi:heme-degrading monooxygenase HmoA